MTVDVLKMDFVYENARVSERARSRVCVCNFELLPFNV